MRIEYPAPPEKRFLVLLNPGAGAIGGPEGMRRRLAAAFAARRVPFDIVEAPDKEQALEVLGTVAERGCRAVVAVGGDGTVSLALRATAGSHVPVAIMPFGTGNQLALNFGIPTSLEDSVRVAVEGKVQRIDLGRVNGEPFALIAGAGLDANVIAGATDDLKDRMGFAAYLYSGLKNVLAPPLIDFRIVADGEEVEVKASTVLLANAAQLGAGPFPVDFNMAPASSFRDGLLDVCIFAPRNLPEVARILWRVTRNKFAGDDRMIFLKAKKVRVEADPGVGIQIDGEGRGETPIEAEVFPLAARILVPG